MKTFFITIIMLLPGLMSMAEPEKADAFKKYDVDSIIIDVRYEGVVRSSLRLSPSEAVKSRVTEQHYGRRDRRSHQTFTTLKLDDGKKNKLMDLVESMFLAKTEKTVVHHYDDVVSTAKPTYFNITVYYGPTAKNRSESFEIEYTSIDQYSESFEQLRNLLIDFRIPGPKREC